MPSVTIDLRQFLNQSHTGIAYNKKEGLIQPLRRFFIPLYRTFVLSAVFLLGLLRGGISLDAPADRFGVIWIPSVNEISKPYFDFAGFFGLHFRSKKGSILNIGVEEKKVEHKSPKSCRIESSNLIFTGGVYALQGLYNKNTGYGTHEG